MIYLLSKPKKAFQFFGERGSPPLLNPDHFQMGVAPPHPPPLATAGGCTPTPPPLATAGGCTPQHPFHTPIFKQTSSPSGRGSKGAAAPLVDDIIHNPFLDLLMHRRQERINALNIGIIFFPNSILLFLLIFIKGPDIRYPAFKLAGYTVSILQISPISSIRLAD